MKGCLEKSWLSFALQADLPQPHEDCEKEGGEEGEEGEEGQGAEEGDEEEHPGHHGAVGL